MPRILSWARFLPLAGLSVACVGFITWALIGLGQFTIRLSAMGLVIALCGLSVTVAGRAAWRGQERLAQATIVATLLLFVVSLLAILFGLVDLQVFKQWAGLLPGGNPFSETGPKVYRLPDNLPQDGGSVVLGPANSGKPPEINLSLMERVLLAAYAVTGGLSLLCLLTPRNINRLPAWGVFTTYLAGIMVMLSSLGAIALSLGLFSRLPGSLVALGGFVSLAILLASLAGLARMASHGKKPDETSASQEDSPPGWHPDPYGQATHRYWDGQQWTDKVQ